MGRFDERHHPGSSGGADLVTVDDIGLPPIGAEAADGFYRLVDAGSVCFQPRRT